MTSEADLRASYDQVFRSRTGFGRSPALLIVDFVNAYTTRAAPFFASGVVEAVAGTGPLLDVARDVAIPVIFTRNVYQATGADGGLFTRKVPALSELTEEAPAGQIVDALAPCDGEIVLRKQYPSAFFATSLSSLLISRRIDTVILVGCTTSGCIRASAVDAISHGFHLIVPRECVGDRHPAPHEASLFDIDRKYGDVLARDAVIERLLIRRPPLDDANTRDQERAR